MEPDELKTLLQELRTSAPEFARLVDVTPRAVTLWLSGERPIPGPCAAYARLLRLLPSDLRQVELNRLRRRGVVMRDGMYAIRFGGPAGQGSGALVFESGRIWGTDEGGARYDGYYTLNENTGNADVKIKVTFPANATSVTGISNPYEWAIDVTTSLKPQLDHGDVEVQTSLGDILPGRFTFMRPLPEAA